MMGDKLASGYTGPPSAPIFPSLNGHPRTFEKLELEAGKRERSRE
jgi:hypothetical protein